MVYSINFKVAPDFQIHIVIWLVVLTILKNIKVNGKNYPIMENKKCVKSPTRYHYYESIAADQSILSSSLARFAPSPAATATASKELNWHQRCGLKEQGVHSLGPEGGSNFLR